MGLDQLMHIDAWVPRLHQNLHDELIAMWRTQIRRWAQPFGELRRARCRDPEGLLRTVLSGVVGFDEPVALEALERHVHLTDVERPDLPGSGFELQA